MLQLLLFLLLLSGFSIVMQLLIVVAAVDSPPGAAARVVGAGSVLSRPRPSGATACGWCSGVQITSAPSTRASRGAGGKIKQNIRHLQQHTASDLASGAVTPKSYYTWNQKEQIFFLLAATASNLFCCWT